MSSSTFTIDAMYLQATVEINAPPERVFGSLTRATALWWGAPYLEDHNATDLILECRVGGRFFEVWGNAGDDSSGALLGTVIAVSRPSLLRLQGPFGMRERAVQNTITFHLHRQHDSHHTTVTLHHQAFGHIDEHLRTSFTQGWHDLLHRLKAFVELHHGQGVRKDINID